MSIPFHTYFVGFLLFWVNMAAVLIVLLGYHLETPESIITWIQYHAVPPASHHGDAGSVSGPDSVRFMLDKLVLRHVFSKYFGFTLSVEFHQFSVFINLFSPMIVILATDSVIKHITLKKNLKKKVHSFILSCFIPQLPYVCILILSYYLFLCMSSSPFIVRISHFPLVLHTSSSSSFFYLSLLTIPRNCMQL